jgi:hypothetical protein
MPSADQLRYYADEAMRWAHQSKTEKEKLALIELARTFAQAALKKTLTQAAKESVISDPRQPPARSHRYSDAVV